MDIAAYLLPVIVLAGLAFILFAGQKRRTRKGVVNTPAPGSPDSPILKTPEKPPPKR